MDNEYDHFEQNRRAKDGWWEIVRSPSDKRLDGLSIENNSRFYIDLNEVDVQNLLKMRLRAIKTLDEAKRWNATYSCLCPGIGAKGTFQLSQTLRWICKFHELVTYEQTPCLRKFLCTESSLSRAMAAITEEEYYATESKLIEKAPVSSDELMKYLAVFLKIDRPKHGFVIFSPNGIFQTPMHYLSNGLFGINNPSLVDAFIHELEQEVPDIDAINDDELLLQSAYAYFQRLVGVQLQCMQLSVQLIKSESGARLQQSLSVHYPWQAVISSLLKEITGAVAPRKCANESCTEFFIAKRSHQLFCSRPGCRKAASRQKNLNH